MWRLIPKVSIPKINTQVWLSYIIDTPPSGGVEYLCLHEEEDDHTLTDERKEYGAEDRYSSEPQKPHLTGEFVIVAKFGGHVLRHLASWLANVVRQGGRLKT